MPKKEIQRYIQFNKKIYHPIMIERLSALADDWGMSTQDVLWKIITDGVKEIFDKRKKLGTDLKDSE